MKSIRIVIAISLLLLTNMLVHASTTRFYHINDLYKISLRETFSVCKDNNGFIWASAKTAVVRIADNDCRVYHLPLKSHDITLCRLIYNHGKLVCYTGNGMIFIYDESRDNFRFIMDMSTLLRNSNVFIQTIDIDREGSLWIASSKGLFRYKRGHLTKIVYSAINNLLIKDSSHLVFSDNNSVCLMDMNTYRRHSLVSKYDGRGINARLYYDQHSDVLWISSDSAGLFRLDMKRRILRKTNIKGLPDHIILCISMDDDGTMLIGTEGKGVYRIDHNGKYLLNVYEEDDYDSHSLLGNSVHDILCNRDKTFFATYSGGLSFLYRKEMLKMVMLDKQGFSPASAERSVYKIFRDHHGSVWLATNKGVIWRKRSSELWNKVDGITPVEFDALQDDVDGNIWVGSYFAGLYILDAGGHVLKHFVPGTPGADFPARTIIDMFRDSDGNMWIGGNDNLYCYNRRAHRFISFPIKPVNAFAEYPKGQLLMTNDKGLLAMDKMTGDYKYLITGCLGQDILVQADGSLWIATGGSGLINYNLKTKRNVVYTTADGLPSNYVNSLLSSDGCLWIGLEGGFCKMNLKNHTFTDYSSVDCGSPLLFNIRSHCQIDENSIYWGTSNGLILFNPKNASNAKSHCNIYIQDITVSGVSLHQSGQDGIPINQLREFSLDYNNSNFMIETLPAGQTSGKVRYSFFLQGVDNQWSIPGEQRNINYTNIPSGRYLLQIRMYDASSVNPIATRCISIIVQPPFWDTVWFRLLMTIVAFCVIYYAYTAYAKKQKRQYEEEKLRFFTNTAHDLRTSITLISAPLKELGLALELSEKSRYFLKIAAEQSQKLLEVANRLLDFQKSDAGRERFSPSSVLLPLLVRRRISIFEAMARQNDVAIDADIPEISYDIFADQQKIEEMIDNLLSNAIKYSQPRTTVHVTLKTETDKWMLIVTDQGIGMSADTKRRLFKEFYRGENATNQKILGSGIGLMIVKKYVEMHHGDIQVESVLGKGSSFTITIPYKSPPEILPEEEVLPSPASDEPDAKTVVVVEDNDDMRGFITESLNNTYEVWSARDGEEAWAVIQKKIPDLVISDVMMPRMNGLELCKLVKSTFETSHIPVILLTALAGKDNELEGIGLGADDYIAKPFDVDILRQRITSLIKNRTAIRNQARSFYSISDKNDAPILTNEQNDRFIKQAVRTVRDNISNEDFDRDQFASALCISGSMLYKKLKALTDQSPTDFIRSIRMNCAYELLKTHSYSVTEVSEKCGFSSINYFSRVFKKYYNQLPTDI